MGTITESEASRSSFALKTFYKQHTCTLLVDNTKLT